MDFNSIVSEIKKKTEMTDEELNKRIIEKQQELSNLVSKEGAAYIIAKELGLDIFTKTTRRLEIKNILPKLRNTNLTARIVRVFPAKEFKKNDKTGKVATLILGDGTGTIRLSLWDAQTDIVKELKPDMAVEVFGAYTKENGAGGVEVRLGNKGGVKVLPSSDIPSIKMMEGEANDVERRIDSLKDGSSGEIRAAVVQLFDTNVFYEVCPTCGKRVTKEEGKFKCAEHGVVRPSMTMVLSGILDDGTGNIRAVFFRENALKLIGMDIDKAMKIKDSFFEHIDVLGKEFVFFGRVRKNAAFNRAEFVVNDVRDVDLEDEINKLLNNLAPNAKV
jgi:replication factor A1